jgi:alanine-glyoxylate transaminase/serine-glyoxylate transaminase/serine-pyruvate transaminase
MAERLGLKPEFLGLPGIEGWRRGVQAHMIEARLRNDPSHEIKAVCVVHNETSTGVTSDIAAVRRAIDAAGHPALLMVDTISGLASADYRHDDWGVDVTVSGSQKGLMLPPGISFNALSPKAIEVSKRATLGKSFWAWDEIVEMNKTGYWPYTPSTNLLYGLSEAIEMIEQEGLDNVFERHQRLAAACRAAVQTWGLEIQCVEEACYSPVLTGVMMPAGVDADRVRKLIYENFNMSLGAGLGKLKGLMFRIGHLGDCNDLTLLATLGGCQMGLHLSGVKLKGDGVSAAMEHLQSTAAVAARYPQERSRAANQTSHPSAAALKVVGANP